MTTTADGLDLAKKLPLDFEQKTAINKRFQELYDEGMRTGKHGHYESMFGAMHQAYAEFAALAARIPEASVEQAGRSSAEPVAYPRMQIVRAHKYTCANVQIGATIDTKCDCGALDTAGQAIPVALAPPAGRQEAVAVKKLEWIERPWAARQWAASSAVGDYFAGESDGKFYWNKLMEPGNEVASIEQAKAAAQADYEARIRSCLSPSGADLGGEVERLRKALIDTGRNLGAGLSDEVSNDFLLLLPEEARLIREEVRLIKAELAARAAREALSSITPAAGEDAK